MCMYSYRKVGRLQPCCNQAALRSTLPSPCTAPPLSQTAPTAVAVQKLPRIDSLRSVCLAATVSGNYQPHISQHQAHVHATALQGILLADGKGPKYEHVYEEAVKKAASAAERLTAAEVKLLTNGLPRYYRHKAVPAAYIESAFDGGMLTLHELARTNMIDLNRAVKMIGEAGQLQKAMRLVEHLIKFQKANQHTLASFFQACLTAHRPTIALHTWERWVPTGLMGKISASAVMTCAAAYDADIAVKVLFRMEERQILMHKYVYHHVMTALASAGDIEQALMIWNHMDTTLDSCQPDMVTIQILLNCVCTKREFQHAHEIFRLLPFRFIKNHSKAVYVCSEMLDRNITPDGQLAATFIKAFSWAGEVDIAHSLFTERLPEWNIEADVYHYNALMYGYAKNGDWTMVDRLTKVMLKEGISPDEYTIVALLTTVSRVRGAEIGIHTVERVLGLKNTHGIKLNKYMCGAFIQAYRRCHDTAPAERCRLAEAVLEEAATEGLELNAFVMNTMISLYWESYAYDKAKKQYDTMIEKEIFPTYYTCEVMSALCAEVGWIDEAAEFRKLQSSLSATDAGDSR